jgi:hypothetical protein
VPPGAGTGQAQGQVPSQQGQVPSPQGAGTAAGGGRAGGLLEGSTPGAEVVAALSADSAAYTWVAAAVGANNAAGYQLATELPVMAVGGFNGSDPSPTLAQFQQYVAKGRIHYFVDGSTGGGGGPGGQQGGSSSSSEIAAWVAENFEATTAQGTTLYDLSPA